MTTELIEKLAYELTLERAKKCYIGSSITDKPSENAINDLINTYNFYYDRLSTRISEFHSLS